MTDAIRPLIAGNWKMNGVTGAMAEFEAMLRGAPEEVGKADRLVCPPGRVGGQGCPLGGLLARRLGQAGRAAPKALPTLEVNAGRALVKRLDGRAHFDELANILFDQALLAEGGQLEDPAAYVKRVNALLVA